MRKLVGKVLIILMSKSCIPDLERLKSKDFTPYSLACVLTGLVIQVCGDTDHGKR